jgi:hypothetical protein
MNTCKEMPYEDLNSIQVSAVSWPAYTVVDYHFPRISTFRMEKIII